MRTRSAVVILILLLAGPAPLCAGDDGGGGRSGDGAPPSEGGLCGRWSFDEGSGSSAYDGSGNSHEGRVNGAARIGDSDGGALWFDGDDDVIVPDSPGLEMGSSNFSVGGWFCTGARGTMLFLDKWDGSSHGFMVRFQPNGSIEFSVSDGTAGIHAFAIAKYYDGKWHHLMMVREYGLVLRLYFDGSEIGNVTDLSGALKDTAAPFVFGGPSWSTGGRWYFKGRMDDVRLYNRTLSADEARGLCAIAPSVPAGAGLSDGEETGPMGYLCLFAVAAVILVALNWKGIRTRWRKWQEVRAHPTARVVVVPPMGPAAPEEGPRPAGTAEGRHALPDRIEGSLSGRWSFDEGSGSTARDSTGNGHDGRVDGAAFVGDSTGGALRFDGDDAVIVADGPGLEMGPSSFSVGGWFCTGARSTMQFLNKWNGSSHGFMLRFQADGSIEFSVSDGCKETHAFAKVNYYDGKWHHLMMVREYGRVLRLYFDGSEVNTITDRSGALRDTGTAFVFGGPSWPTGDRWYYKGKIADVRLYKRSLPAEEVRAIFAKTPSASAGSGPAAPEETRPMGETPEARQSRLDRIEGLLLEGKISEATYLELQKKHGGGP